jgi:hypothetical protein
MALLESNQSADTSLTSGQRATSLCSLSSALMLIEKLKADHSRAMILKIHFLGCAIIEGLMQSLEIVKVK